MARRPRGYQGLTHYHVVPAVGTSTALVTLTYESYEEAIYRFVGLTSQFFSDNIEDIGDLSLGNAFAATAGGNGAKSGDEVLSFYFMPCEDEPCMAPNWN